MPGDAPPPGPPPPQDPNRDAANAAAANAPPPPPSGLNGAVTANTTGGTDGGATGVTSNSGATQPAVMGSADTQQTSMAQFQNVHYSPDLPISFLSLFFGVV